MLPGTRNIEMMLKFNDDRKAYKYKINIIY